MTLSTASNVSDTACPVSSPRFGLVSGYGGRSYRSSDGCVLYFIFLVCSVVEILCYVKIVGAWALCTLLELWLIIYSVHKETQSFDFYFFSQV